ncbi:hypothetical protein MRX96_044706 [Rhipicephalus microplus]
MGSRTVSGRRPKYIPAPGGAMLPSRLLYPSTLPAEPLTTCRLGVGVDEQQPNCAASKPGCHRAFSRYSLRIRDPDSPFSKIETSPRARERVRSRDCYVARVSEPT